MKHFLGLLCLVFLLSSCKITKEFNRLYKMEKAENYVTKSDYLDFKIDNNMILVDVKYKGDSMLCKFDSGCTPLFVYFTNDSLNKKTPIQTSTGETIFTYNEIGDLETAMFKVENAISDKTNLNTSLFKYNILGSKFLFRLPALYELKFSENKLQAYRVLSYRDFNKIDSVIKTEGYIKIKSKKSIMGSIYLYIEVDSEKIPFLFDTGYNGEIAIPLDKYKKRNGDYTFIGTTFAGAGGYNNDTVSYIAKNLDIKFLSKRKKDNIFYNPEYLFYASTLKPVIGMDLITQYDWLIDTRPTGFAMYIKKNKNLKPEPIDFNCDSKKHLISIINGNIKVISVNKSLSPSFELNSIIRKIDGVNIDSINIDYYYDLLQSSCTWNDYIIETQK